MRFKSPNSSIWIYSLVICSLCSSRCSCNKPSDLESPSNLPITVPSDKNERPLTSKEALQETKLALQGYPNISFLLEKKDGDVVSKISSWTPKYRCSVLESLNNLFNSPSMHQLDEKTKMEIIDAHLGVNALKPEVIKQVEIIEPLLPLVERAIISSLKHEASEPRISVKKDDDDKSYAHLPYFTWGPGVWLYGTLLFRIKTSEQNKDDYEWAVPGNNSWRKGGFKDVYDGLVNEKQFCVYRLVKEDSLRDS